MSEAVAPAAVAALVKAYFNAYPADAARDLERLDAEDLAGVLAARPADDLVEVFRRLSPTAAADALRRMEPSSAGELLRRLDPAQGAVLVSRLSDEERTTLLAALGEAEAAEIRESMSYPPDTAGALMDPEVVAFSPETTAEQALDRLRGARKSGRHAVFLVDTDGKLMGSVPVLELAVADAGTRLDALADLTPPALQAMAGRPEILETFENTKRAVLAVVDFHGRLLGVVRHAALLEAAREEVSADIQAMVGASREETALSTVSFAVRKRLPWLQINLLTAFLAASVVGLPSLSTPALGGSCLPSRLNCWTRPIATVLVAQSMQTLKPTVDLVGNAQEWGLVPSVGVFPPKGTTSASVAVQFV